MPPKFAPWVRACGVIGALVFGAALATAQSKSPLLGLTRDQVVAKFGQPKSNIVAGDREIIFVPGERLVLRDNVVIEVEDVPIEPAAPPPPAAAAAEPAPANPTPATARTSETDATAAAAPAPADTNVPASEPAGKATVPAAPTKPTPPPSEAQIISVRPPSRSGISPAPAPAPESTHPIRQSATAVPPAAAAIVPPIPSPTPTPAPKAVTSAHPPILPTRSPVVAPPTPQASVAAAPMPEAPAASAPASPTATVSTAAAPVPTPATNPGEPKKSEAPSQKRSVQLTPKTTAAAPAIPDVTENVFSLRTYLISAVIIIGGIVYLVWRRRERQLALTASAVSASPFVPQAAVSSAGTRFTGDLLAKLEWKRFEELVAAYYNKTGVVAARTKSGPASAVHIRISWKGEPRPFACVQCISHPTGLIEAKPIQALVEAIAAEDIRRGYVVTSGKFSVPARDVAEEKHITLLTGDIFLEKLNALPEPARVELMRDASAGDYMTPTCPQCETKLSRSPADPSVWQCPQCGTVLPRQ